MLSRGLTPDHLSSDLALFPMHLRSTHSFRFHGTKACGASWAFFFFNFLLQEQKPNLNYLELYGFLPLNIQEVGYPPAWLDPGAQTKIQRGRLSFHLRSPFLSSQLALLSSGVALDDGP